LAKVPGFLVKVPGLFFSRKMCLAPFTPRNFKLWQRCQALALFAPTVPKDKLQNNARWSALALAPQDSKHGVLPGQSLFAFRWLLPAGSKRLRPVTPYFAYALGGPAKAPGFGSLYTRRLSLSPGKGARLFALREVPGSLCTRLSKRQTTK